MDLFEFGLIVCVACAFAFMAVGVFGLATVRYAPSRAPWRKKPPPVELDAALLAAASEDGRRIARLIAATDYGRWEFESDHAHHHGSPRMSVGFPSKLDYSYYQRPTYEPGVYFGSRDKDLALHFTRFIPSLVASDADIKLCTHAVAQLKNRKAQEIAQRQIRREQAALRAHEAAKARLLAKAERIAR